MIPQAWLPAKRGRIFTIMKTPKNAYGRPETLRRGPFPCKGEPVSRAITGNTGMHYTPEQAAWMKEHKPLYYTGKLHLDINHLPAHLRSL